MRDLSDKLTVFVISSGNNPNYDACLQALNHQTCKFKLDIIKDYKPMSRAFQEMLDRCQTELFIQIDEDMIMQENSIERMYNQTEGERTPPNISMNCYLLRDVHLDFNIYGVKIYKTALFKQFPFNLSHPSAEVEQLARMKEKGYDINFKTEVMGEHSPHWNKELIFERYYNLMEKFKLYHYKWMEELPKKLYDKIKANPSDLNIHALAGALSSIYSNTVMEEEKDFSKKRLEYGKLQGYLEQPHQVTLYMTSNCNFKCQWCVTGDTKILTENLIWKPISDIKSGDKIMGFNRTRLMEPTTVVNTLSRKALVYKIVTDKGVIKATSEHPFLNKYGRWITIQDLKGRMKTGSARSNIRFLSNPTLEFKETDDYKIGYINGIIQGDGTVGKNLCKDTRRVNVYTEHRWIILRMKDREPLDRYKTYLKYFNIHFNEKKSKHTYRGKSHILDGVYVLQKDSFDKLKSLLYTINSSDYDKGFLAGMFDAEGSMSGSLRIANFNRALNAYQVRIGKKLGFNFVEESKGIRLLGGMEKIIEFFSLTNPALQRKKENSFSIKKLTNAQILSIEELGYDDVYNLTTTTQTFWANGFASHNCYRQHGLIEQAPDMTVSLADVVLKKFPNVNGVCICGFGEPMSSNNLIPVVDFLKEKKKYVGLITNGSLLTKRFKDFNHKPDYISVSLNAYNAEEHEKTTGTKTWNDVIEGIKLVNNSSVPLYISSVVTKKNIKDVPKLLKLLKGLGVTTVHLHNLLPHMDLNQNNTFWDDVLQKEDEPLINELKQLPESDIIKLYPTLIDKSGGKNSCDFAWYSFSVNGHGNLSFCNSVLPCDKKYGNISDFVIWNSETAQKFREDFCNKKLPHCSMCFRNWKVR